ELTGPGAALGRPINFTGVNATLRLDGVTMPTDVISGFTAGARWIDLPSLSFSSSGSAVISGSTLAGTEGGIQDRLQLDQSLNYSGLSLQLIPDASGGTEVAIGQIATVSSGGSVSNTIISSGFFEDVFGGANNDTVVPGGVQIVYSGAAASGTLISGGN